MNGKNLNDGKDWSYEGEVDEKGVRCGAGVTKITDPLKQKPTINISSSYFEQVKHGISKKTFS